MSPLGRNERYPPCCEVTHSETVEDYLKTIYHLTCQGESATTSVLARRLAVSAPSVSVMVQRLVSAGLAARSPDRTVRLTPHGTVHARGVVRRHRLLETFLAEVLDVPWDEVHAEAELLEHAVSARLTDRIEARLGYPSTDPHGDPIPPKDGAFEESWPEPLSRVPAGTRFLVQRVSDRDSAALRHLARLGIRPGTCLSVGEREPFGGPLWVTVEGASQPRTALGSQLAEMVFGSAEVTPA